MKFPLRIGCLGWDVGWDKRSAVPPRIPAFLFLVGLRFACPTLLLFCCATAWAKEPPKAETAFQHGLAALAKGNLDAAVARFDDAVRLEPKQAKFMGLRGVARLYKGDYARGAADLKAAVALNPGDAGANYRPASDAKLSAESLRHGREQVAAMLRDRPAMARFGEEAGFLRDWAMKKFAGEDFGEPIDWDPSPPLHSDAEHLAPGDGQNAVILVEARYTTGPKENQPRGFEELWAGAVYELHNVCFAREYIRLNAEADEGKVSKEEFVAGILKFELQAAQRTRAFYLRVFLPWAERKKLPTDPSLWFCDWWDSPEDALKNFANRAAYPWRPYARQHDWATVHHEWRRGRFAKAQKLLEQMQTEKGYDEELSDVSYWIGRCWMERGHPTEAVAAFSEAIRIDPDDAEAYLVRGEAYEKLGEKAKAAADRKKAKELEAEE